MFTFLHAADIHLDSKRAGLASAAQGAREWLTAAPRQAFQQLVDLALERAVDLVLIAGDVYDGDWEDYRTGLFLVQQLQRLQQGNIPVVMISGNHDAANRMTKSLRLPPNVTWFGSQAAQTWEHRELHVAVHGQSFAERAVEENLAADYPAPREGWFNIGLLHSSAHLGGGQHDTYAPCSLATLVSKGYDYWALGHVHQRQVLHARHPVVAYAGNLQGRHVRETGAKGCWVVEVDADGSPQLEFAALDVMRWAHVRLDVNDCGTPVQAVQRVEWALGELLEQSEGRPVAARIELTGASPAHDALLAEPARWQTEILAAALQVSGDRLWVERIGLATQPLNEIAHAEEGLDELSDFLAHTPDNPALQAAVREALEPLWEKLPQVLRGERQADGTEGLGWNEPAVVAQLIREALAVLRYGMAAQQE